ncbi:MAG: hypothetical protein WAT39_02355 [Planctomycetota bacterium]
MVSEAFDPQAASARFEAPFAAFTPACLGDDFAAELRTVSGLWFRCGYRPGVAAYLNFFLLRDFITLHDERFPPRFRDWKAMAKSFYETDLFIRAVTDSGREPTGGISSPHVREQLASIMARHRAIGIPLWMMSYFGWSLLEAVETTCAPLTGEQQRLHLDYMSRTWRLMGVPFTSDRARGVAFARAVERRHAAPSPRLLEHARAILRIGELIGVRSAPDRILPMLPTATQTLFAPMATLARPGLPRRVLCRLLGPLLVPRAVGKARIAVPWSVER